MTTYARAEIAALVLRAARGAGVPLGWAEDLSVAAEHYGTSGFLAMLPAAFDLPWQVEVARSDAGVEIGGHPVAALLTGLDAIAAGESRVAIRSVAPAASGVVIASWARQTGLGVEIKDEILMPLADFICPAPLADRFEPDRATYEALSAFAARTYVPETEDSRAAGAGAGLVDND